MHDTNVLHCSKNINSQAVTLISSNTEFRMNYNHVWSAFIELIPIILILHYIMNGKVSIMLIGNNNTHKKPHLLSVRKVLTASGSLGIPWLCFSMPVNEED